MKSILIGMRRQALETWITEQGEKPFRGQQISKWLYEKHVRSFAEMTDLSKSLREQLEANAIVSPNQITHTTVSRDGTTKFLVTLADQTAIECVTIVQQKHLTACLSSQVGCNVKCPFCATGLSGFKRNLTVNEIVDQYLLMQQKVEQGMFQDFTDHRRISQIVFMGMGEPLLNYNNLLESIAILNKEIGIGIRHITISTAGVIPGIQRLMDEPADYNLAISLHSADPEIRNELVPINRKFTLPELLKVAREYAHKTGRRMTFEYTMLKGINTRNEDARLLAKALRGIHCHINLIAYNPVDSKYQAPEKSVIREFQHILTDAGYPVTIRQNHGQENMSACGQLKLQQQT